MIKILTNADRNAFPALFDDMYRARARHFHDRLGWAVMVRDGREIDRYDEVEDPVYLMAIDQAGRATGSLRILPTTGSTMLKAEFADFFDEPVDVESPTAWECTRFCVHPPTDDHRENDPRLSGLTSTELLAGLCDLCISSGIEQVIGLYDSRMTRVYARIGWSPAVLARSRPEVGDLIVGIWDATAEVSRRLNTRLLASAPMQDRMRADKAA